MARGRGRPACPVRKAAREAATLNGHSRFTALPCPKCGNTEYITAKNTCAQCARDYQAKRRVTEGGKATQARAIKRYQQANPAYTLARDTLKRLKNGAKSGLKTSQVFDLVGYTSDELRAHMETLFTEGMSWDNHGEWHIDHIKPVAAFKAEGITDVAIINALTNLQPLWAADNLSKGGRYE